MVDQVVLQQSFTNLSQISQTYGAPTVQLAEKVIQHTAQGQIYSSLALLGIFLVFWTTVAFWHKAKLNYKQEDSRSFVTVFGGLSSIVIFIISGVYLSDIWMWTALTDPAFALAHQVFGSMG